MSEGETPKTARQILDLIDEFLITATRREVVSLWDVLSALRGPDNFACNTQSKDRLTVHIRRGAFPRMANRVNGKTPAVFHTTEERGVVTDSECHGDHFLCHALHAMQYLFPKDYQR